MLRRVDLVRTDVSEELSASFIRVTRIDELRTTLAVASNRRMLWPLDHRGGCEVQKHVEYDNFTFVLNKTKQRNYMALSPQANYTDWAIATCRRNLVPTFVEREESRGQRGGSPTVVNLSFLDRSRYISFK
jgi:hypothetical protein